MAKKSAKKFSLPDVYLVSRIPRNKMAMILFVMLFATAGLGSLLFSRAASTYTVRFVVVCASNVSCSQSQATVNSEAQQVQNWYRGQVGYAFNLSLPGGPINSGQTVAWFQNNACGNATSSNARVLCNIQNIPGVNTSPYQRTIVVTGFRVFTSSLCGLSYVNGYTGVVDPAACPGNPAQMYMAHELGHTFNLDASRSSTYTCSESGNVIATSYHSCNGSLMDPWSCLAGWNRCALDATQKSIIFNNDAAWFNIPPAYAVNNTSNFEAAFEANSNSLWTVGSWGNTSWGLGMYPGTSPSIAYVAGGYEAAFESNSGTLWTVGSAGNKNWGLAMAPGTSPSITAVSGGYEVAYQSNSGALAEAGTLATQNFGYGMAPGTSPGIAPVSGGTEIAYQSNSGLLNTTGALGNQNWNLGMYPGTSPSIAYQSGGYEVAFEANSGSLWSVGNAGNRNWSLGMYPGTSPSITGLASGGYEIAFESNTGSLYTAGTPGVSNWNQGMMPRTSPSITSVYGGYQISFQANTGVLITMGNAGNRNWNLGMNTSSSPAL